MFDNTSLLSLQLHLVYDRNTFGSPSVVFGNLRKMCVTVWKMLRIVNLAFGTILENLRKSSENRQKWRHKHVYIISIQIYTTN